MYLEDMMWILTSAEIEEFKFYEFERFAAFICL